MSLFEGLLQRYGQRVLLWREGAEEGTACRAFLQPIRERGEQVQASPLGAVRQDKWLCLGEPGIALEGLGDGFIQWAGRRFRVISAQPFYLGTVFSHWRAGRLPGLSGGALQPGAGLLGGALRTEGAAGIRAGSVCAGARRRSGAPDRL